jgi:hypothetical protein
VKKIGTKIYQMSLPTIDKPKEVVSDIIFDANLSNNREK